MKTRERVPGKLWPKPEETVVAQIIELGYKEYEIVTPAIRPLLRDENHQVSSTAALVLNGMWHRYLKNEIKSQNPIIKPLIETKRIHPLTKDHYISFQLQTSLEKADLTEADLRLAHLEWAYMPKADLTKANLSGAKLIEADLSGADLRRAILSWANLNRANLSGADLTKANLSGANLNRANLSGANLSGADLNGADLNEIKNWKEIKSIKNAGIFNLQRAPEGFLKWALEHGAIDIVIPSPQ